MKSKKLRIFLCLFHAVLCAMVFNQQSFAGTWADAFEDDNTYGWKIANNTNNSKWWIDADEVVCETFVPNVPSILATGEADWRNYSFSCKAKLDNTERSAPRKRAYRRKGKSISSFPVPTVAA